MERVYFKWGEPPKDKGGQIDEKMRERLLR